MTKDKPNFFQALLIRTIDNKRCWKGNAKGKAARVPNMIDLLIAILGGIGVFAVFRFLFH